MNVNGFVNRLQSPHVEDAQAGVSDLMQPTTLWSFPMKKLIAALIASMFAIGAFAAETAAPAAEAAASAPMKKAKKAHHKAKKAAAAAASAAASK
jgi:hypothetical protein